MLSTVVNYGQSCLLQNTRSVNYWVDICRLLPHRYRNLTSQEITPVSSLAWQPPLNQFYSLFWIFVIYSHVKGGKNAMHFYFVGQVWTFIFVLENPGKYIYLQHCSSLFLMQWNLYKFMTCCYAELSGNFEELLCNDFDILVEVLGFREILNPENFITCAWSRV